MSSFLAQFYHELEKKIFSGRDWHGPRRNLYIIKHYNMVCLFIKYMYIYQHNDK